MPCVWRRGGGELRPSVNREGLRGADGQTRTLKTTCTCTFTQKAKPANLQTLISHLPRTSISSRVLLQNSSPAKGPWPCLSKAKRVRDGRPVATMALTTPQGPKERIWQLQSHRRRLRTAAGRAEVHRRRGASPTECTKATTDKWWCKEYM